MRNRTVAASHKRLAVPPLAGRTPCAASARRRRAGHLVILALLLILDAVLGRRFAAVLGRSFASAAPAHGAQRVERLGARGHAEPGEPGERVEGLLGGSRLVCLECCTKAPQEVVGILVLPEGAALAQRWSAAGGRRRESSGWRWTFFFSFFFLSFASPTFVLLLLLLTLLPPFFLSLSLLFPEPFSPSELRPASFFSPSPRSSTPASGRRVSRAGEDL